jgi:hypothetical protein
MRFIYQNIQDLTEFNKIITVISYNILSPYLLFISPIS